MAKIEFELDEQALKKLRRLAEARGWTLEQLIKELIGMQTTLEQRPREIAEESVPTGPREDAFLAMFAEEPELIDQVTESAMKAREAHPLRQTGG
jgi:hypothetical protein